MPKVTVITLCKPDQCPNFTENILKRIYGVSLEEFAETLEERLDGHSKAKLPKQTYKRVE